MLHQRIAAVVRIAGILLCCAPMPAKSAAPTPLPQPFGRGIASYHPTRYAPYAFAGTIVRLHFDFARGVVYGDETAIVTAKESGLRTLPFNTNGISYASVSVNGKRAAYAVNAPRQAIDVQLHRPAFAGERLTVEFKYRARPQRGMYFVRPDKGYPHVTPEIWTQGEPTDNRRWFPTWDEPNQKTPSELFVTVPRGWTVVANGYLKAHTFTASTETWDWNSPRPKSTYLIAFTAGPLSKNHTALGSLDVDSYVQPAYAGLNALCFGRTNEMIAYFQRLTGVKYPWEKYSQATAERFTFGGMEDASATIQTALALHPAIQDALHSCDVLVSHELAQQWFGDDATMTDWSHLWLHEGFATYFDELWSGRRFGQAEFEYRRYEAQQAYFAETQQYYRPIVDYVYADPLDLFDASSHQRPGEILHMLRHMVGDARFFKALHDYLREYRYKNADTHDFFAAVGKSLGTDLTWFEDEWFYRDDYPNYYVTQSYDKAAHTLTLRVRQKNHSGKPYRMPVTIQAFAGGEVRTIQPVIDSNEQVVAIKHVPSEPQMVLFDPNNEILRQLTFPKSARMLAYQLADAKHVADREWALGQLGALAGAKGSGRSTAMQAVRKAALSDPFYGLRADAASVAASFGDIAAVEGALHDSDKRVRIAAENAAGSLKGDPPAAIRELEVMSGDADPDVAAAALASLGTLKAPGAYDALVAALNRPSFRETIAAGALSGLAAYGDLRALPLVRARTAYGTQEQERDAAIVALAQLAQGAGKPQDALPVLLPIVSSDPLIGSRNAATNALAILGDAGAIPVLQQVERSDSQLIVRINAWSAILTIRSAAAMRAYSGNIHRRRK